MITNKIGWCMMIIVGDAMGYDCDIFSAEKAKISLDSPINKTEISQLEKQAVELNNRIARDNRTKEANEMALNVFKEL